MRITLADAESFIKRKLRVKLQRDLRGARIIRESDLEACVYYHLRKFLRRDSEWNIVTRHFVPQTGYYVDVLLFRKGIPRLAFELKWHRDDLSTKDRKSLNAALQKLKVNKAYYLTTAKDSTKYERMKKQDDEKYRFRELVVGYNLSDEEYEDLRIHRRKYGGNMSIGKNSKKYDD